MEKIKTALLLLSLPAVMLGSVILAIASMAMGDREDVVLHSKN